RPGSSVKTAAAPHVGKKIVLHLDLQEFFHSVTFARVRGMLIALGYGYPVATTLAVLMTEAPRQAVEVDGTVYHVPVGHRRCVQGLSRQERRRLRALIHQTKEALTAGQPDEGRLQYLRGKLAYLAMLNKEQAEKLRGLLP